MTSPSRFINAAISKSLGSNLSYLYQALLVVYALILLPLELRRRLSSGLSENMMYPRYRLDAQLSLVSSFNASKRVGRLTDPTIEADGPAT